MTASPSPSTGGARSRVLLVLASLLCALACEPRAAEREACVSTNDCMDGMVCINERCRSTCNSNADCDEGLFCVTGFCLDDPSADPDAAVVDAGGADIGAVDSARVDAALSDAALSDAALSDAASADIASVDLARSDLSSPDTSLRDSAGPDLCQPYCQGRCAGAADGCGGNCPVDDCAGPCCGVTCCAAGMVCDTAGACCQPQTCGQLGHECGSHDNGCGGYLDCGGCSGGASCEQGQCVAPPVDCSAIAANPNYELCESSASHCAGVFLDGTNCVGFCAAAGLSCSERYGGEPGCQLELHNPWDCDADNGHGSDWCVCR